MIALSSTTSGAQDQVEHIPNPNKSVDTTDTTLVNRLLVGTGDQRPGLRVLLRNTIASKDTSRVTRQGYAAIVHVVQWESGALKEHRWFVYEYGREKEHTAGTRVLGARDVDVLVLHYASPAPVGYRIEIRRKRAAPVQSAVDLLALVQAVSRPAGAATKTWQWSGRTIRVRYVPSKVTLIGLIEKNLDTVPAEFAREVFLNEGKYRWDISVGLPVTRIDQLAYSADDGVVRTVEIDKQSLLAFANFFLIPADLENPGAQLYPHFVAGLALSRRPLDRLVFGIASGFGAGQAFVGVARQRIESPGTFEPGDVATKSSLAEDLRPDHVWKFVAGLNAPVRYVLDQLQRAAK